MKIGLIDVDGKLPNLALMKISRYHKDCGDDVEWCDYISHYDIVYKAKIFTFTQDDTYYLNADKVVCGGTGYDMHSSLPPEIDRLQPDYSLYPNIDKRTAYGFLTRGCPNRCNGVLSLSRRVRLAHIWMWTRLRSKGGIILF